MHFDRIREAVVAVGEDLIEDEYAHDVTPAQVAELFEWVVGVRDVLERHIRDVVRRSAARCPALKQRSRRASGSDWRADDVREAARTLAAAIETARAAPDDVNVAARELVLVAEGWHSPKLYHAMSHEAGGIHHDLTEDDVDLRIVAKAVADFLELIELAASDRAEGGDD